MRSPIADLEIGFSANNANEWDLLQSKLASFSLAEVTPVDFSVALDLERELAASGLKGRKLPDLLNAAVALRLGLTRLHYDRDFKQIATVSALQQEWVVPAGSA